MKWKEHLKRQLPSNGTMNNCTGCACWHTLKAVTRRKRKLSRHTGFVVADCLETGACRLPAAGRIKKRYVMQTVPT